jgi:predicted nucleotidyltransferase
LAAIHRLALSTGKLRRFVVFGSFVTAKPAPGDVDVFLIMEDDFAVATVVGGAAAVFDHALAHDWLGASIFWVRALAALGGEQAAVEY